MAFSCPTGRIEPGILYVVLFNVVYGLTLWDGLRVQCSQSFETCLDHKEIVGNGWR